jgi:hypothetical protein
MKLLTPIFMIILCIFTASSRAAHKEITSFDQVYNEAKILSNKYSAENVLIVLDIDNTVLAPYGQLGSDQWFSWQAKLMKTKSTSKLKMANNYPELLLNWGEILSMAPLRLPESRIESQIKKLQKNKFVVMALTSRGHEFKFSTLRELHRNGINFSINPLKTSESLSHIWDAFTTPEVANLGFSKDFIKKMKFNGKARKVSYLKGIFFTQGHHKGGMLNLILAKSKFTPKAILFVDDKKHHTAGMVEAYENKKIEVVSLRYGVEDDNVEKFDKLSIKDKTKLMNDYHNLIKLYGSGSSKQIQAAIDKTFAK